ncbi:hypothetical protein HYDPIDRAFT_82030 [Hydnomerulius pinastri MD-312]|nr:hypothetical protein HYDPIDRAFT_82030 [Hydnomerulius pinastri MD-312]
MASLALHQTRSIFSAFRLPWTRPLTAATLVPAFLSWQKPFNLALPTLQSLLELLPPIVLAVPKSKVSHSRKAMRSANKGLKDKKNIVNCPACGEPKLAHHACRSCYNTIIAKFRQQAKPEQRPTANGRTLVNMAHDKADS